MHNEKFIMKRFRLPNVHKDIDNFIKVDTIVKI